MILFCGIKESHTIKSCGSNIKEKIKHQNMNRMKTYSKLISLWLLVLVLLPSFTAKADDVNLTASAPKVVRVGEQFRLTYTINRNGDRITPPALNGFALLSGPNRSTSTSIQSVNGRMTQSVTNSFTYILMAEKEGKFTIPAAKVKVKGKVYSSNPVQIEVVKGNAPKAKASQKGGSNPVQNASGDKMFAAVNVSDKEVYLGESLTAEVKIYTKTSISGLDDLKLPSFSGFWSQEIPTPQQISLQRENVNGDIYETGLIKKQLLFPQRSGEIIIEPVEITLLTRQRMRSNNPFDDFFGGSYRTVPQKLKSKPVKIKVKPLPANKPASFAGGVGQFTMNASIDNNSLKVNDAITLKITISGSGNLKLIKPLNVNFPPDFEVYDPKTSTNVKTANGVSSGSVTFEYLIIPRHGGDFRIAPIEFSYFDLRTKNYKTSRSEAFEIHVEKGDGEQNAGSGVVTGYTKEDIKYIGKDIRYLKNNIELKKRQSYFFGSKMFLLAYAVPFVLFLLIIIVRRSQIKQQANQAKLKNRKAGRVSQKRLKIAAKSMAKGEREQFYDEILKAIWGYLSDKLSIPVAELSKDNVSDILGDRKVSEEPVQALMDLLAECEFARYAPASVSGEMSETYKKAGNVISSLDQNIKG
jgi:hypothetical protein